MIGLQISKEITPVKQYQWLLVILVVLAVLLTLGCASSPFPKQLFSISGAPDSDKDGIPDQQELKLGLNPNNPDTDGDGWTDYAEIVRFHTNPLIRDTDHDGVIDSKDFLPLFNNTQLYIIISTSFICIVGLVMFVVHRTVGLTKGRKQAIREAKERNKYLQEVKQKIHKIAEGKYGSVRMNELITELEIDTKTATECLKQLKTRRDGEYYRFPDIEKKYL